jgi:thioredoxin-like negative regulator of GroEL
MGDMELTDQSQELSEATERLLASVEDRRNQERQQARRQLRGISSDQESM